LEGRNCESFTQMIKRVYILHEPYRFDGVEGLESCFL
jgi:hypothetical protein